MLVEQCSDCRLYIPYNRLTEVMHGRGQNFYICIYMPQLEQTKLTNVSLLDRNNRNFKQKKKKIQCQLYLIGDGPQRCTRYVDLGVTNPWSPSRTYFWGKFWENIGQRVMQTFLGQQRCSLLPKNIPQAYVPLYIPPPPKRKPLQFPPSSAKMRRTYEVCRCCLTCQSNEVLNSSSSLVMKAYCVASVVLP